MMDARERFVAAVVSLVGVPLAHRGRNPAIGLDCVGVVMAAAAAVGHQLLEPEGGYGKNPQEDQLTHGLSLVARRVALGEHLPGDVLQVLTGRQARHVHVAIGGGEIVHGCRKSRRIARGRMDPATIRAVWRLRFLDG